MKVINVMAVSLDGTIASHPKETDSERRAFGFTNWTDQNHVRTMLLEADAVITGANSLRTSRKVWAVRNKKGSYPVWCIYSRTGIDRDLEFWSQSDVRRIIVSPKKITDIVDQPTLKNFQYDVRSPAKSLMDHLRKDPNIDTVLLFGGGQINRMFYDEGLVDELSITICPVIIGTPDASRFVDPGLANPTLFQLQSSIVSENHVFLTYSVRKT